MIATFEQGRVLNGIIDRLYVDDEQESVWIIDYKTNRNPPKTDQDIPRLYRQQMQAYYQAITKIYPHYSVRAALLWTASMQLMELDF